MTESPKAYVPGPRYPSTWWPHIPKDNRRRVIAMYPLRYRHQLRIVLVREGCVNRTFFTIQIKSNLAECKQLGMEQVGSWDPIPNQHGEQLIALNFDRISYWIGKGAKTSDRVAELLGLCGFFPVHPRSQLNAYRVRLATQKYLENEKLQTLNTSQKLADDGHGDDGPGRDDDTSEVDVNFRPDSVWRKGNEPSNWWYYGLR